jgi:hypothetical protein
MMAAFTDSGAIFVRPFTVGVNMASASDVETNASSQLAADTSSAVADRNLATRWLSIGRTAMPMSTFKAPSAA